MDHSGQAWAVAPEFVGRDAESASIGCKEIALTRAGALRLDAIDLLRGLVIALMVLDHVRDFLHATAFAFDPTDLRQTNPLLFMTRWVTHLCAPTFVFLSGVSIFMQRANGKPELSKFLLTRGLWLIVLEFTVVSFGINWGPPLAFLQVIWAIGASMVLMAAVVRLPAKAVLALGAAIVIGHQWVASFVNPAELGAWATPWFLTMQPGPAVFMRGFIPYPVIPWFGIMCVGYGLGFIFRQEPDERRRNVLALALSLLAAFVVLRAINGYGNPVPWAVQSDPDHDGALLHQCVQVSAVVDVCVADLGRVHAAVPGVGQARRAAAKFLAGVRSHIDVHLHRASLPGACAGADRRCDRRRSRVVLLRLSVASSRAVRVKASTCRSCTRCG